VRRRVGALPRRLARGQHKATVKTNTHDRVGRRKDIGEGCFESETCKHYALQSIWREADFMPVDLLLVNLIESKTAELVSEDNEFAGANDCTPCVCKSRMFAVDLKSTTMWAHRA
jgi:hypothetical protein